MMKNFNWQCFIFLVLACSFVSCGPKTIFESTKEIKEATWPRKNPIVFDMEISDTTNKYDIILNLNAKEDFAFTNLYVKVNTTFPNKSSVEDIVSLELNKSNGQSNGKCSGGNCTTAILFQEKVSFNQIGKYSIAIDQYSRIDTVKGINEMELKVVQSVVEK